MMITPSIEQLTQGKFNRYALVIATAKCARIVTDEYVAQREQAENHGESCPLVFLLLCVIVCNNPPTKSHIENVFQFR